MSPCDHILNKVALYGCVDTKMLRFFRVLPLQLGSLPRLQLVWARLPHQSYQKYTKNKSKIYHQYIKIYTQNTRRRRGRPARPGPEAQRAWYFVYLGICLISCIYIFFFGGRQLSRASGLAHRFCGQVPIVLPTLFVPPSHYRSFGGRFAQLVVMTLNAAGQ